MKPLLVFDLDGTLIDSAPDIITAVNRTLMNHKKQTLSDEVIVSHIGEGLKKLIADLFREDQLPPAEVIEVEMEFLRIYEAEMFNKTKVFNGVFDFLESYDGPMGIITNKNERPAKAIIKHLGLDRFNWVDIYGADTLAERKPSPLPLETMMNKAQHSVQSTFMIGDGIPDVLSALRAKVPSIAIGFGYTAVPLLEKYEPKAILQGYDELHQLIENLRQI